MGNDYSLFIFAWSILCRERVDRKVSDLCCEPKTPLKAPLCPILSSRPKELVRHIEYLSLIIKVRYGFHEAK